MRRLLRALTGHASLQLDHADMPPRQPIDVSHWEAELPAAGLPEVLLPQGQAPPHSERPQVHSLAASARR